MNFPIPKTRLIVYSISFLLIIISEKIFHEILYEEGIHLIINLQSSKRIINFFKIFSFLGSKIIKFYLFIIVFCICNFHSTFVYIVITYFSQLFSATLKFIYKDTRPFLEFYQILSLDCETGYGFPSSHELTSIPSYLIFFDILFFRFGLNKLKYGKIIHFIGHFSLFIFYLLLGVSRMVAGVHYLHQIIFGFTFGYLIYFIFTDLLKFNTDETSQNEFIQAFYNYEKTKKYLKIYWMIYFSSFILFFILNRDNQLEENLTWSFTLRCGHSPKYTPYQKSLLNTTEYFAIFGALIGIKIDICLNNLQLKEEFVFENISYNKKYFIGNWNDTNFSITLIRVLIGLILGYINTILIKNLPIFPNNVFFTYFLIGTFSLFTSMMLFFGFSKNIFYFFNLSKKYEKINFYLQEKLLDI